MHTVTRALVALGLVLTLGACGGEGDPEAAPPSSPSSSPSVTPPTAPPHETARQFIYRWVELDKYAQNSGDTESYRLISRRCESCESFADRVDKIYAAGGYVRAAGMQVLSIKRVPSREGTTVFHVSARAGQTEYRTSENGPKKSLDGGRTRLELQLERVDGAWVMGQTYVLVS